MNIDEVTLRAFVDGELSPNERERVEALIAHNDEARRQVEALRASSLPFRAAFDAIASPPMPDGLAKQLSALSAVAHAGAPSELQLPRRHWLYKASGIGLGLAATFTAGVLVRPALLLNSDEDKAFGPWVQAIASYQSLYVRETLGRGADSAESVSKVLNSFRLLASANATKGLSPPANGFASLVVPDLSSVGLSFRRAQLLGFGEQPLMQMAYLPAEGKPAALCVLPLENRKDSTPLARRMDSLSIVAWQKQGMSYVLAVDMPLEEALKVGRKIHSEQYPTLVKSL